MKAIRELDFNFVPRLSLGFTCLDPERLVHLSRPYNAQTLHGPCPSSSGGLPPFGPEPQTAQPKASVLIPGKLGSKCQSPHPSLALLTGWSLDLYHSLVSGPDLPEEVDIKKLILIYTQVSFWLYKWNLFIKPHPSNLIFFFFEYCFHYNFLLHSWNICFHI